MAHFYGTLQGNRGRATRCATKKSGLVTQAASYSGAIEVQITHERDGLDHFSITEIPWHGRGIYREIASGILGDTLHQKAA